LRSNVSSFDRNRLRTSCCSIVEAPCWISPAWRLSIAARKMPW